MPKIFTKYAQYLGITLDRTMIYKTHLNKLGKKRLKIGITLIKS